MERRIPTMEELERMARVDIRTADPGEATDIREVEIDASLPVPERVRSYLAQARNPYILNVDGVLVKTSFAEGSGRTLADCLETLAGLGAPPA